MLASVFLELLVVVVVVMVVMVVVMVVMVVRMVVVGWWVGGMVGWWDGGKLTMMLERRVGGFWGKEEEKINSVVNDQFNKTSAVVSRPG